MKTKVLFVKSPKLNNEITAVFPYELGMNNPETMTCYSHFGQHNFCSSGWVYEQKKATESEYNDLYDELIHMGYELEILKKFPELNSYKFRSEKTK